MKIIEQYNKTVRFAALAVLDAVLTTAYGFVWYYSYNVNFENRYIGKGIAFTLAAYFAITAFTSIVLNIHKIDEQRIGEIFASGILSLFFANCVAYVQISLIDATLANPLPLIYLTIGQTLILWLWAYAAVSLVKAVAAPERMIIVYGSHLATDLVLKMSEMEDKYRICVSVNISDGIEAVVEKLDDFDSVIICDVPAQERNDILKYCYEHSKKIYIVPKISDVLIRGSSSIPYFDCPLLCCTSNGLTTEQQRIKRLMDIIISSIALVITSPLFLIISVAIKLCDRGPVFFTQERVTINCKHFNILKFRSMIVDAEADGKPHPATERDSRITPVGRVIRKLRLDELPQLINILRGDMSVVGPRPERVEHVEIYSAEMPEFLYRYKVKGGLTGYAQVYGRYNTIAYNKLKLDLTYIQNYSVLLDLRLLLMTVKILFKPESTQGFDTENTLGKKRK